MISTEPVGPKHKDGKPHLTDVGWTYWHAYWRACDKDGRPYTYPEHGGTGDYPVTPTLVINLSLR